MQPNFLSTIGFRMVVSRLPATSFYIQRATIPGVSVGGIDVPTPFRQNRVHGDHLMHDEFSVTVRVDEEMKVYKEMYDWISKIAISSSFDQYKTLKESDQKIYSDITLVVMNSRQNPAIEITMIDAFPLSISSINLDTTSTDEEFATLDITFRYNDLRVGNINIG